MTISPKREILAKLTLLEEAVLEGQPKDYAAYREMVGAIRALRELEDWYNDQLKADQGDEDT